MSIILLTNFIHNDPLPVVVVCAAIIGVIFAAAFIAKDKRGLSDRKGRINDETGVYRFLAADFSAIYYVDLNTGLVTPVGESVRFGNTIEESAKAYGEQYISEEDRGRMTEALTKENVAAKLRNKKSFSEIYLSKNGHYCEMKAVRADESNEARKAIIAFGVKDREIREDLAVKKDLERNLQIIGILASDYTEVCYIDLETEQVTPYRTNGLDVTDMFFKPDIRFSSAFESYVDKMVYGPDRDAMKEAGSVANIKSRLTNSRSFVTTYRCEGNPDPFYCEMKFVKVRPEEEEPTAVVLGYIDKDEEIMARFINKRLRDEYDAIFLVDLQMNRQRVISYKYENVHFINSVYSENVRQFSREVTPKYREMWENLIHPDAVREFLKTEDRREAMFEVESFKYAWNRCVWQVVERENGLPTKVLIAFMRIDDASSEKLKLSQRVEEQKIELEQQQKMLEEALARAEAANKAKSTFLSNMSHDIRTPMNAIIGFTNIALANLEDTVRVKDYLNKTARASSHLLSLINDVLDMSRIESGKMKLEDINCDFGEIMQDISTILLGQAEAKEQHMFLECIDVPDEHVICDKLRLNQVLINLASNAVKFTPVGGDICIYVNETSRGQGFGVYEFRVKDNGIGMSREFCEKLFLPFEREHTSTISKTQGTGLGMAITKNIIDTMGGTIEVTSEPGKGTEFVLSLVMKLQQDAPLNGPIREYEGAHALIIDKDPISVANTVNLLQKLNINADSLDMITDGNQDLLPDVIARAEEEGRSYSLFFVDTGGMDGSGLDNVRILRSIIEPDIPVIAMTLCAPEIVEEKGREVFVSEFVHKPVFMTELHKTLEKLAGIREDDIEDEKNGDRFAGCRVLLVEDNELNSEIAKVILEESGFVVDTAENGKIAVDKIDVSHPGTYDVVLMDIQMPVMDGYEATEKIRAMSDEKKAGIPIVAMTANAFAEDSAMAHEKGMDAHVAKPIEVKRLLEVISDLLKK